MTQLVLLGGGGHCESCVDVIASATGFEILGVLDRVSGNTPFGVPWLGDDSWLAKANDAQLRFLVTVGQGRLSPVRKSLFDLARALGHIAATVCSADARVSRQAEVGPGSIVMHRALVNAGARVGDNCIVNTGAIVEHGCSVGAHCHVSTGAILNGEVQVGDGCMIGSGAVVLQGISIVAGVMVAAGAVVTRNIDAPGTWVGIPARRQA